MVGREIKFRAWDGHSIMFYQKVMNDELWFVIPGDEEFRYPFAEIMMDKSWIKLQYTGLKDKNSVEIFEGDILRYTTAYEEKKNLTVEFINGCFRVNYPGGGSDCAGGWTEDSYESIGTIYENPELIEEVIKK